MKQLSRQTSTKIVLLVMDGLGGLPHPETGKTELETAQISNLDNMAATGVCGMVDIIASGITPGSAPGHFALFGYNPFITDVGRGVLEAVGIDFELQPDDIAARGNFCTVDNEGRIIDRRAGRIATDNSTELCRLLDGMVIDDVTIIVRPVREHRFVAVFRGNGLVPEVSESDPQQLGVSPLAVKALSSRAEKLAAVANRFISQARTVLADHHPANMVLLRGFSNRPHIETMNEVFKLTTAAITVYPMYRGLARLVGMDILDTGTTIADEVATLQEFYQQYDFFFIHIKGTDSAGEDGDFNRKVAVIEEVDRVIPELTRLQPDVFIVTGDHSTPALLKAHSWHPVPLLLQSPSCRTDGAAEFSESACVLGGLGRFPATEILPLAMAHAMKLEKFGA
jgi:2,3-bisphosphoglycerate-independent phosphoglycerate mutase